MITLFDFAKRSKTETLEPPQTNPASRQNDNQDGSEPKKKIPKELYQVILE